MNAKTMREIFREHHRLSADEAKAIWDSCLFTLDTNVLLNIYRYATPTREDLFRVLRHLGKRIWVPYQVAKEFYARRLDVIREQRAKYEQLSRSVSSTLANLNSGAFTKSGFLKIAELQGLLQPAIGQAVALIEEQRAAHPDLIREDPYLEDLVKVVGVAVGEEPPAEQREKEITEARVRIDKNQPPGFSDAKKPEPERYGDVLIWFELVRLAQSTRRPIVFVTDDDKEDWWQIESGHKLGPRPELREEMRKMADVEFNIYNPARLMELIGTELAVSVPKSSIDDARTIAEELQASNMTRFTETSAEPVVRTSTISGSSYSFLRLARTAEDAVALWLSSLHPQAIVGRSLRRGFDFVLVEGSRRVGIEVKFIGDARSSRMMLHKIRDFGYRAFYEVSEGDLDSYLLVLVGRNIDVAIALADRIDEIEKSRPLPSRLSIGFLDEAGEYTELVNRDFRTRS